MAGIPEMNLTPSDHDRNAAGMTYVYPVVSRRASGVSVGINLNPNSACNWRCLYCQVPELQRGSAPPIDVDLLASELDTLLTQVTSSEWMESNVPEGSRRLNDIAFSGNGEPTTCRELPEVITAVQRVMESHGLLDKIDVVLITNGSLLDRDWVSESLRRLASHRGEVWFKLDRADAEGRALLNDTQIPSEKVLGNLVRSCELCRTRLQTMVLAVDGEGPDEQAVEAWIELVRAAMERGAAIHDVLLYGLARESYQPEATRLSRLPSSDLERLASRITADLGLPTSAHP